MDTRAEYFKQQDADWKAGLDAVVKDVKRFLKREAPHDYSIRYNADLAGHKVYVHRNTAPELSGDSAELAEIVFEGLHDWAYDYQDYFAAEGWKAIDQVDVEIGMNGYCLMVVGI
jgi:hypothetical protein